MSDGQEPTNNQSDTPTPDEPTTPEPKTFDEGYVKELRAEAAKSRKALRETQAQLDQLKQAQEAAEAAELEAQGQWQKLAEQEAAKRADLEQRLVQQMTRLDNERRRSLAITTATRLGAIDPGDANFAAAVAGVDVNADDAAEQVSQALEALKEQRPYLFQSGRPGLSSFNPGGEPAAPKETRQQALDRIYGGGGRIFDADNVKRQGGGVFIKE